MRPHLPSPRRHRPGRTGPLQVRAIEPAEHLDFIAAQPAASFLQTPAWGKVKPEWRSESIGWFHGPTLVGVALVLHRPIPRVPRSLAYLPEGPVIDWADDDLSTWLTPMADHLRGQGAFTVRMGPPVVTRRWSTTQIKDGIADPGTRRLTDLPPDQRDPQGARVVSQLTALGWRPLEVGDGFAAGQPQFVFQIPLVDQSADGPVPRTEDDVLRGMNQLWRRNIKKAEKSGVVVTGTTTAQESLDCLPDFHALYLHTAERDHFVGRPLGYFRTMVTALAAEDPGRIRLWCARHEGDLVAATIAIRVGTHAWYAYGASSTDKREVRGSNAVQWAMIRDALAAGAEVYDLRGITDTLDAEDDHVGLIQFKVGTGGEALEYAGEWDLPLNRLLHRAFEIYLARRSGAGSGAGR